MSVVGTKFSCQTNEWLDAEFTHDKEMINVFKKAFRKALEKKCCHSCYEEKELDQATMPNCCGGDCGKECCCAKINETKDLEAGAKLAQEIADVLSKRWGRKITPANVVSQSPLQSPRKSKR